MLRKLWGRPPGLRGTPASRSRNNDISIVQGANRPTGASAADQGVRPTIRAEWPPGSKVSDIELKHAPPLQLVCLQRWGGLQPPLRERPRPSIRPSSPPPHAARDRSGRPPWPATTPPATRSRRQCLLPGRGLPRAARLSPRNSRGDCPSVRCPDPSRRALPTLQIGRASCREIGRAQSELQSLRHLV